LSIKEAREKKVLKEIINKAMNASVKLLPSMQKERAKKFKFQIDSQYILMRFLQKFAF